MVSTKFRNTTSLKIPVNIYVRQGTFLSKSSVSEKNKTQLEYTYISINKITNTQYHAIPCQFQSLSQKIKYVPSRHFLSIVIGARTESIDHLLFRQGNSLGHILDL